MGWFGLKYGRLVVSLDWHDDASPSVVDRYFPWRFYGRLKLTIVYVAGLPIRSCFREQTDQG